MDLDLETFLTTLYVLVDDMYKSAIRPQMPAHGGPTPRCSDSEVLCLGIAAHWRSGVPWRSERGCLRYLRKHGRGLFPQLTSQSAFNRRLRRLWGAYILLQQALQRQLDPDFQGEIMDALPLRVVRHSRSFHPGWLAGLARRGKGGNDGYFYGFHLLLSLTSDGFPTGWSLGSANLNERWLAERLFSARAGQPPAIPPRAKSERTLRPPTDWLPPAPAHGPAGGLVLADAGYSGRNWGQHWRQHYGVQVVTPDDLQTETDYRWFNGLRRKAETAFASLTENFDLAHCRAHTSWGVLTAIAAKIAAFCLGIQINRLCARPDLAFPTLIV